MDRHFSLLLDSDRGTVVLEHTHNEYMSILVLKQNLSVERNSYLDLRIVKPLKQPFDRIVSIEHPTGDTWRTVRGNGRAG